MKKAIIILSLVFACVITFNAQTCVYVCSSTGASGWAHGYSNSCDVARNNCINEGGTSPYCILNTASRGYGAIYIGTKSDGGKATGAAAGYSNLTDAKNAAKNMCISYGGENVYCADYWKD